MIDDEQTNTDDFTLEERLARAIYLLAEDSVVAKICGRRGNIAPAVKPDVSTEPERQK